jgi:hypothetical protein
MAATSRVSSEQGGHERRVETVVAIDLLEIDEPRWIRLRCFRDKQDIDAAGRQITAPRLFDGASQAADLWPSNCALRE